MSYRHTERYYTPASAATFTEFTTYWLGPSTGSIPLFGINHDETIDGTRRDSNFNVTYAYPFTNGRQSYADQLSIVQRPPLTTEEVAARDTEATGAGEEVTVNGRLARLYDGGTDGAALELTISETFVTIHGSNRGQVLDAAAKLRVLCSN